MYNINFLHLKNSDSFFKLRKFMTNTLIQKQFKIDFFSYLSHIYTYIRIIVAMCAGIWICYSSVCVCVCVCVHVRARTSTCVCLSLVLPSVLAFSSVLW